MAIIVEGFDNSGKSTLAASFGLEVLHPGPRPQTYFEMNHCLKEQEDQARLPVVMDRITAISHPCYAFRDPNDQESLVLTRMLRTHHCILIYCRPPLQAIMDFSRHIAKSYDDEKKLRFLKDNAARIVKQYDRLMEQVPHMRYDYTHPDSGVVQAAHDAQFTIGAWKKCQDLMTRWPQRSPT